MIDKEETIEDFERAIRKLEDVRDNDLSIDDLYLDGFSGSAQSYAMEKINSAIFSLMEAVNLLKNGGK